METPTYVYGYRVSTSLQGPRKDKTLHHTLRYGSEPEPEVVCGECLEPLNASHHSASYRVCMACHSVYNNMCTDNSYGYEHYCSDCVTDGEL